MIPGLFTKEHILSRMEVRDDGCWQWTLTPKDNGYGLFYAHIARRLNGKSIHRYAHRVACELWNGPIPDGYEVDHLCRNTLCVNPAHLEAVTRQVNLLRGNTIAARNAAKTNCPSGHAYDEANTYWFGNARQCRACGRRLAQRKREALRASA